MLIPFMMLIFGCNTDTSRLSTFNSASWASSARTFIHHARFVPISNDILRTTTGQYASVEFLRKDSSYFIVLNEDTFTDPGWNYTSHLSIPWFDTSITFFTPVSLYDIGDLKNAIITSTGYDSTVYFLVNNTAENAERKICIGAIHKINIDEDTHEERVIEIVLGSLTGYFFFDDSLTGWKSHGKIERWNRNPFWNMDAHLSGYVGFQDVMWGTGIGATFYDYYRLTDDSVQLCFTINTEYGFGIYPLIGCNQYLFSTAESHRVGDRIKVVHHSQYDVRDTTSAENVLFKCTDQSQYEFIPVSEGRFTPLPRAAAFNVSDSTMFVVEYAMMKKVYQRKRSGSAYEKYVLRNLEEDSIPVYR